MNRSWAYWCYVFVLSLAITDFVVSGTRNNFNEDVDKDAQDNKLEKSGTIERRFRCVFNVLVCTNEFLILRLIPFPLISL